MTKRLLALVLSAGLSLGTATAAHADDAQANTLFVGAVKALRAAPAAGPAPERLEAVQSALVAFDRIVAEHPASSLAVSIITGQPIGAIDVAALRSEAETLTAQIAADAARAAEAQAAAAASSAALGDNAACLADPACAAEKLIAAADGDNDYRGLVMRKRSASVLEVVAGRGAALLESYEANLLPAVEDLPRGAEAQGYMAALHWLAISGEQQAVRDHLDTLREGDFPGLTPEQAAKLHRQTVTMLVTTALGASDIELARFWADGAGYDNLEGEALLETYFKRVARSSPADIESWMASGVEGLTGYKDWAVQAATAYLVMKDDPRAVEAAAVFDEMTKDPSGRVVAVYRSVGDTEAAAAELDKVMSEEQPFSDLVQMARAAVESGDVALGREVLALFQQLPPFESDDKYKRFSVAEGAFRASALAALP